VKRNLYAIAVPALAVSLLLSMTACKDQPTDPGPARTFSGWITDSLSGLPVDSAAISIQDTSGAITYSDSTGYFHGVARADAVRMFARKSGYETRWEDVVLGVSAESLWFELPPIVNP